ncbi:hypothetical protein L1987_33688 [Smallanthus sonchifolius]|uniref:Uncharacterized protein n=1 Tax=Smallanthus sonchifolius TaxID=185202 RepID=A0ACB9HR19_9ASTR|nr:hypothetical protein L1987_33688 [Smallanthus sonchifolius]
MHPTLECPYEEFSNQILATMLYLGSVDNSKRMYMYIHGRDGDLTPSMTIYDTMQSLQSLIGTHCVGDAYNLAGFLLAAGEKLENMNKFKDHVSWEIIHIPDKAPFPLTNNPQVSRTVPELTKNCI